MDQSYEHNNTAREEPVEERKSDTGKDIKKGMDNYEEKIKSGEVPIGDATRSEE